MTLGELEAACDAAVASGQADMTVTHPGRSFRGNRLRIDDLFPGISLAGHVLSTTKLPDGTWESTLSVKTKAVAAFLRRARYRTMYHRGTQG